MPERRVHDTKIIDETHRISDQRGNGQLRREVWVAAEAGKPGSPRKLPKKITRYNLAYINHELHSGDNGRVVGYDNQHGYHHRHYFGKVSSVDFTSFEAIEDRFESDWLALRRPPGQK
jgi:hypothetical protein